MLPTVWDFISYLIVYVQYKGICVKTPDFKTAILSLLILLKILQV